MIEFREIINDSAEATDTLTLPFEQRQKSRQRVRLDSGREAGLLLPIGTRLHDGDQLRADDGEVIRIRAAEERLSMARCADPVTLARACYHLGNRHIAVEVAAQGVRYRHDHVLDDMLRGLGITVTGETAAFEPEPGAYGQQSSAHHGHSH